MKGGRSEEIKTVAVLGSGGLRIGQAGEFDYSGSQAIKALKEEGIRTVLINPNIATVQTDASMADEVYFYPLTTGVVSRILKKERPDGLLASFGGQTALNLALDLEKEGLFEETGIRILGTSLDAVRTSEDRALFKRALKSIQVKTPESFCVSSVPEALSRAERIGYPIMIRSGFSLGGLGSGKIDSKEELRERVREALLCAPHVLIEEYLAGWKEFEYEVIRDADGNGLTVCNMENLDPMGVHTGESIVVAPSQTLTDFEYHRLRKVSLDIADHFRVIGECNIQYALNPENGEYRVIEMNPRLSRSSALASKATGYPLAFVATKLALGFRLHEVKNVITRTTTAFFEPALDYLVVKIPRWDTKKLSFADRTIGTEMKSVGEVMAIGRSFPEALQKAVQMLNIGKNGPADVLDEEIDDPEEAVRTPTDYRLFALCAFFRGGGTVERAAELSRIDPWFLTHIASVARVADEIRDKPLDVALLRKAKKMGFADKAIGALRNSDEERVREMRLREGIVPFVKQIDTLAGEFDATTNYLYMTYHGTEHDVTSSATPPVIVLGSGPYCIGSSVEFDWCAVNTVRTLRKLGFGSVMINSNPETVSTDYDESDRLYFEVLSLERVRDIADFERAGGIIVSVGGQIANNLASPLSQKGYPIIGTPPECIDRAEDREQFSSLLRDLGVDQPDWRRITNIREGKAFAGAIGYPVLVRPSFVLSGATMAVAFDDQELEQRLSKTLTAFPDAPVVVSQFIRGGKEIEVDGVAQRGEIVVSVVAEHIEHAGVHSGDATIVLPPQRLDLETMRVIKRITQRVVKALQIVGPFNIQFISKNHMVKIIECNLRASRSFPFASKTTGHNFIEIATRILMGEHEPATYDTLDIDYVGVKAPLFSYHRLKGSNPVAHVEMASTGEVACLGRNPYEAFFHAYVASGQEIRGKRIVFSISDDYKAKFFDVISELDKRDWDIYATEGTHDFLSKNGIGSICLYKANEPFSPNVKTIITNRKCDLIVNIPNKTTQSNKTDGYVIRRLAVDNSIPLVTNAQLAMAVLDCLVREEGMPSEVRSWREFLESSCVTV